MAEQPEKSPVQNSCVLPSNWSANNFEMNCPPMSFRLIEPDDFSAYSELYTNERTQQFIAPVLSNDQVKRRFNLMRSANTMQNADKYYLTIAEQSCNEAIGSFAVFNIDMLAESCEIGVMMCKRAQARGFARHAMTAILRHLQQLGFSKVFCMIHQQNLAAQRLARLCQMRIHAEQEQSVRFVLDEVIRDWRMND